MSNAAFDYLTGVIQLDVTRPLELAEGLGPFYEDPNNPAWGSEICRTLYHESVHFWQFLSSAYLANMVADEWHRVESFQETGKVPTPSKLSSSFRNRAETMPFSAHELCECWARYWDVHTRSPNAIIQEEKIDAPIKHNNLGYAGENYDVLMRNGVASSQYEAPYRWMLERLERANWSIDRAHKSGVASYLVALVFPATVHAAFGSPDPVGVTCAVIDRLSERADVARQLFHIKTGSINLDWLRSWSLCRIELIQPILEREEHPAFTSGFDVIQRGHLKRHPFFPAYLARSKTLLGALRLEALARDNIATTAQSDYDLRYRMAMTEAPLKDPWIVFALPGQPKFRMMLGQHMHAPQVTFTDSKSFTAETALSRVAQQSGGGLTPVQLGTIPQAAVEALDALLRRFRVAEYAASRGLPPDAFD